jgi:hypothetical protein
MARSSRVRRDAHRCGISDLLVCRTEEKSFMFGLQRSSAWLCGALVLASVSRPLFTAVHNRIGKSKDSQLPESASVTNTKETETHQPNSDYGKLPIYFEPNLGQTHPRVKFIVRSNGVTTFLTVTEAVFSFRLVIPDCRMEKNRSSVSVMKIQLPGTNCGWTVALGTSLFGRADLGLGPTSNPLHSTQSTIANRLSAVSMKLVGANPRAQIEGLDRLPGVSNYFIGNDPAKWRTIIPHYGKVRSRRLSRHRSCVLRQSTAVGV